MRKYLFPLLFLLILTGCGSLSEQINSTGLVLTQSDWYTSATESKAGDLALGKVHLLLKGHADADRVTVTTYGDGVVAEKEIALQGDKKFEEEVIVAFRYNPDQTPNTYTTQIKAYQNGSAISVMDLKSDPLVFTSMPTIQ